MILTAVPDSVLRAANSEVRKVTSLRSSRMLAAVAAGVGVVTFAVLGMVFQEADSSHKHTFIGAVGPAAVAAAGALLLAVVLSAVFGALSSGSEYRYGTLAVNAQFTPDRNLLLGSKLAVTAGFSLAVVLVLEVLGGAVLTLFGRDRVQLGGALFAVLGGVALAAVCWSVIGAALGFVFRSPTQAMAAMLATAVLEPLVWLTARAVGFAGFATLLPISATVGTVTDGSYAKSDFIAPTPAAIAVLILWTAGAVAAAWWILTTRDL
ncbi:ABC transporter permease subunit [Nocardia sp. NBC_01388]|uniref:ABC transporter permease subunit n=1 Tax=Nocardia sp. NBC_01388 TaxID=2903596 RepID=UPI0032486D79